MTMTTVPVELGERRYDIHIAPGLLDNLGDYLIPHCGNNNLLISDDTVAPLYAERVLQALQKAGIRATLATFPAGEKNKSITSCEQLWKACADAGIDRSGSIIALGGGVTGDMAGFIAATWMRGISFVQIPTTLLAMVDSSVGGKTGVNSIAGKNLIGAFQQPHTVIIDPAVTHSMESREYRAGLAEVVKYGVINDPDLFAWLEANSQKLVDRDLDAVGHAVAESCRIKAWYVCNDEKEHGVRAHLNYGHTFGHALERETKYTQYFHGEAVSIGMQMAAHCAENLDLLEAADLRERQTALLTACGLPTMHHSNQFDAEVASMTAACSLDKKVRGGKTRFVLPRNYGEIETVTSPDSKLIAESFASAMSTAS